jgi:hypothetical protein
MKKIILFLPALVFFFCATSCLNTDDEDNTTYYEAVATVSSNSDKPEFITDYGVTLVSTLSITSDTGEVFHNGQRVFVRFSYGDTINHAIKSYPIEIAEYGFMITSDFKTVEADSTNPYLDQSIYYIYRLYISGNYFNSLFYTYQTLTDLNTCELVRIKKNEHNAEGTSSPYLSFELRHNAEAVNYGYYKLRLYSYDLSPLIDEFPEADSLNIKVSWNASTGNIEYYDFVYRPVLPSVGMILKNVGMPFNMQLEGLLKP